MVLRGITRREIFEEKQSRIEGVVLSLTREFYR